MDERHRQILAALYRCSLQPASFDKRFVRDLHEREKALSEKQAAVLEKLRHKYRRQLRRIAPALVADLVEPAKTPREPSADELRRLREWNEAAKQFKEGA